MSGKYVYKNITDQDHTVIGVGIVKAGDTVETDTLIENPNFVIQTNSNAKVGVVAPTKPKGEDK